MNRTVMRGSPKARLALGWLIVLSLMIALGPNAAGAGTLDDPEVPDGCGDSPTVGGVGADDRQQLPWNDLDAAWFQLLDGDVGLAVTMQLCGDLPATSPTNLATSSYHVYWRVASCVFQLSVEPFDGATVSGGDGPAGPASLRQYGCVDSVAFDLADDEWSFEGNRLSFRLPLDGTIGRVPVPLIDDDLLARPQARVYLHALGDAPGGTWVEQDFSQEGRDFVLDYEPSQP